MRSLARVSQFKGKWNVGLDRIDILAVDVMKFRLVSQVGVGTNVGFVRENDPNRKCINITRTDNRRHDGRVINGTIIRCRTNNCDSINAEAFRHAQRHDANEIHHSRAFI